MKTVFLISACIFCLRTFSQFSDDFSDGDFTSDPAWSGNTSDFIITADAEKQLQLQGDCASGGEDYLSTPVSTADSTSWTFYVHMNFDPSSSNYTKIFLKSNSADLSGTLTGYYVKIGEDGSGDVLRLYRQDGTTSTLVTSGTTLVATAPALGIRVIRTAAAEWQLWLDPTGGTSYALENAASDATYNTSGYFGIYCKYTSTRCTGFYFDDFFIDPIYVDTDPPEILSLSPLNATQVSVLYNEDVDLASSQSVTHYAVDHGIGNPLDASRDAGNHALVTLTFGSDFPAATLLTLNVSGVQDLAGNTLNDGTATFTYYMVQAFDIVIDEILADPDPPQGLPDAEYIELYNTTDLDISLAGYTFTDGSTTTDPFPGITLPAHSYLLVCDEGNAGLFAAYPDVLGINNFPSLNNDGDDLTLFNAVGFEEHNVYYSSDWYQNPVKAEGGYALEMIDASNPCEGAENWIASNDPSGGTPDALNSVHADNPDITAPVIANAFPTDADTLELDFDESVTLFGVSTSDFSIDNGIGNPSLIISDADITNSIKLALPVSLEAGIVYTVTVTGITDCSGNLIASGNTAQFAIPQPADSFDIIINEVLFNPVSGGVDYVELYNRSQKIIDLSSLTLLELDIDDPTQISESTNVSVTGRLFFPGTYICITSDISQVAQTYFPPSTGNFIEDIGTPNYPDNEGIVAIVDNGFQIIDRLHYTDDWHYPLLKDKNGVSLERVSYEAPTQDADNWHSAAEDVHFGTPGYQNSDFGALAQHGTLNLEYGVFSPDGDGYHDLLLAAYDTPSDGYTGVFRIFDVQGRLVKDLDENKTLSREGVITWDGTDDSGNAAKTGIYILYAEFFDLSGNTEKYKLKCTLARRQ